MADKGKIQELVDAVRHNARYQSISEDLIRRVGLQELQKRGNFQGGGQVYPQQAAPGGRCLSGKPDAV